MVLNKALITEFEVLNTKNNIYKKLLIDLEMHQKNESLIFYIKKIIKHNHKILINIEDTIENELDFSESDDLLEKLYNQPTDFSKLINKKYFKYDVERLRYMLSRKEEKLNFFLTTDKKDYSLQELFDIKLKILAIMSILENKE
jgi:hypothetical protein